MLINPIVPEDTCPYIDVIQSIIDSMVEQDSPEWRENQAVLAKALLEHVRESNYKLRAAGKHWHAKAKKQR